MTTKHMQCTVFFCFPLLVGMLLITHPLLLQRIFSLRLNFAGKTFGRVPSLTSGVLDSITGMLCTLLDVTSQPSCSLLQLILVHSKLLFPLGLVIGRIFLTVLDEIFRSVFQMLRLLFAVLDEIFCCFLG